ncbi:RNA polymerase sigma-70 factor (ECF subfamily) [Amphiplicatus metriothermophilus]|nr:RNA polymerase sigma-70 factor (ECF subfamily) [Amphiplicatus metriothermophilus]
MSVGEESDEELASRVGGGDRLAAGALVARHADRIFATCYRMLGERAAAEDAAQETFMRLWKHASRWRPRGAKLETWLYRIAMNVCLDMLRRRKRMMSNAETVAFERADETPSALERIEANQTRAAVAAALAALPERQRAAIVLCHYQELSNIDAAAALDVSVEAVESLLSRARRSLREKLLSQRDELLEGARHGAANL